MNKKIKFIFMIAAVFAILLFSSIDARAIGIAPSKKIIDYTTDPVQVKSRIVNTEDRDMELMISAGGDFSEYITIDNPHVILPKGQGDKYFTYTLDLPEGYKDAVSPGPKTAFITVTEISGSAGQNIGGTISVTQQLQLNIPYEGKYANAEISVTSDANIATYAINMNNIGTMNISSSSMKITASDSSGKIFYSKDVDLGSLGVGQSNKYEDKITFAGVGEYILHCVVFYDGKNIDIQRTVSVGKYGVDVVSANVGNFRLGTVAKLEIGVSNAWNAPIENVHADIIISDQSGDEIETVKTDKIAIDPKSDSITAYWDTADVKAGSYSMKIVLYAGNEVITKEFRTVVDYDEILISPQSLDDEKTSIGDHVDQIVFIMVVFALVVLLAALVIGWMRRK